MKRALISLGLLGSLTDSGVAGRFSYECTVRQFAELETIVEEPRDLSHHGPLIVGDPKRGSDSNPVQHKANFFAAAYVGKRFQVDRRTGVMVGKDLASNTSALERKAIIAGSSEWSYMLLSMWPSWVQTLTIVEYSLGEVKPFLLVDGTQLLAGTCE